MKLAHSIFAFSLLAHICVGQTRDPIYCSDSSAAANAITCATIAPFPGAYREGQALLVKVANANTAAVAIAVDGLASRPVIKGTVALAGGELAAGAIYLMVYDGAGFQVQIASSGGGAANAVTSASMIPAGAIVTGQDGARGVQGSAASVDALGNGAFPGDVRAGTASGKTGSVEMTGVVSGNTAGWTVPDALGSSLLYVLPSVAGSPGQFLQDTGSASCPTNAPGSPTTCHQLAWATPSGGGGGSGLAPWNPAPSQPPALASWTQINTNSHGTFADVTGGVAVTAAPAANELQAITAAAPAQPFTVTAHFKQACHAAQYSNWGLAVSDGTRYEVFGTVNSFPDTFVGAWTQANSGHTTDRLLTGQYGGFAGSELWYRLVYDGTNLSYLLSPTGTEGTFTQVYNEPKTAFLTTAPTRIGMGVSTLSATPACTVVLVYWAVTTP